MKCFLTILFVVGLSSGSHLVFAEEIKSPDHCEHSCGCVPCGCALVQCKTQQKIPFNTTTTHKLPGQEPDAQPATN